MNDVSIMGIFLVVDAVLFENRYISANATETDQVEFVFALKYA